MKTITQRFFTLVLLIVGLSFSILSHAQKILLLSTASPQGSYHPTGQAIADLMTQSKKLGAKLKVIDSAGSIDNINRLINGTADLAIIQADMLYKFQHALPDDKFYAHYDTKKQLTVLLALFPEYVQILIREDSSIHSLLKLNHKRIYIGAINSGSRENALDILKHFKINYELANANITSTQLAIDALKKGELDAVFTTSSLLKKLSHIKTLSINADLSNDFINSFPYYGYKLLTKYNNIGVFITRAILVARNSSASNGLSDIDAYNITSTLFENPFYLDKHVSKNLPFFHNDSKLRKVSETLHPGAKQYYDDHGILFGINALPFTVFFTIILILLLTHIYGANTRVLISFTEHKFVRQTYSVVNKSGFYDKSINKLSTPFFFFLFIALPFLLSSGITIISYTEQVLSNQQDVLNPFNGKQWFEVLYWMTAFAATGFNQDLYPNSPIAKVVAIAIPIIIMLSALYAGLRSLSESTIKQEKLLRGLLPSNLKDHIVICGWNARVPELIHELTSNNSPKKICKC